MIRGYEVEKEKYVVITDEELEKLAPKKGRDIDLRRFVKQESIPPVYFDRSYFLTPGQGSEKAYRLLAETMEKEDLAGIATFVMRGKEYLVAIFPENGILRAETMRFSDELRSPKDIGLPAVGVRKNTAQSITCRQRKQSKKADHIRRSFERPVPEYSVLTGFGTINGTLFRAGFARLTTRR